MRTSLLPGMLDMLAWNLNRGAAGVRLFEAGRIFENTTSRHDEKKRICLGATGHASTANVLEEPRPYSFFDLKGDVETLLSSFAGALLYDTLTPSYLHPGRSARALLNGKEIAQFGQLHPDLVAARKFRQQVFVAELYLDVLYQQQLRQPTYTAPPKFPAVDRDFSFLFADATKFKDIRAAVAALNIAALRSFTPAEIFRGGNVPAGKYSLLLRALFQATDRTLREEDVAQWSAKIIAALQKLGASLRA
jgi:phenylalanyl-tRNA synthetase beta chain